MYVYRTSDFGPQKKTRKLRLVPLAKRYVWSARRTYKKVFLGLCFILKSMAIKSDSRSHFCALVATVRFQYSERFSGMKRSQSTLALIVYKLYACILKSNIFSILPTISLFNQSWLFFRRHQLKGVFAKQPFVLGQHSIDSIAALHTSLTGTETLFILKTERVETTSHPKFVQSSLQSNGSQFSPKKLARKWKWLEEGSKQPSCFGSSQRGEICFEAVYWFVKCCRQ